MDPISGAIALVAVINAINKSVLTVKGNKQKAKRLALRISTIVPVLNGIISNKSMCSVPLLEDLIKYVTDIRDFILKFTEQGYFKKMWKSNSDALMFTDYNEGFAQRVQTLQFDVQVISENHRQEDAHDEANDLEEMKHLVEQILLNQGLLKDEIQLSLQELTKQNNSVTTVVQQGNLDIIAAINRLNEGGNHSEVAMPAIREIDRDLLEFKVYTVQYTLCTLSSLYTIYTL